MLFQRQIRRYIYALFLLSLGGWMLHFRIHPIRENPSNFLPFILGILNILVAPVMFNYKKTVVIAYCINGVGVIIGTITMVHLSLSALPHPLTVSNILFKTMIANVLILFAKLPIGHSILMHFYPSGIGRMFTPGWWVRHFCYFTVIYTLGHFLWR